jgi:hypothetical protein
VAIAIVAIAAIAYLLGSWRTEKQLVTGMQVPASTATATNDRIVEAFWARFLGSDTSPVIAYPDAVFLLDDSNDLCRFRHGAIDSRGALVDPHVAREFASNPAIVAQAGQLYYENGYTGTGELESIAMLGELLGRMGNHKNNAYDVLTLSRLPDHDRATLSAVSIGKNHLDIAHSGRSSTRLTNVSGPGVRWRAAFAGTAARLYLDGKEVPAKQSTLPGGIAISWVDVIVATGTAHVVSR